MPDDPIGDRPLPTPDDLPAELKGRRGMPSTGKYPFRNRKSPKKQRGHAWALSDEWKPIFVEALAQYGTLTAAADRAGIDFATAAKRRKLDPEFDAACKDALQRCRDTMVMNMYHRAFEGPEKFAWDNKNKKRVSLGRQPDPILAMFAIKQMDPTFRENHKADESQQTVQVVSQLFVNFLQRFKPDDDHQADAPTFEAFLKEQEPQALPPPESAADRRARLLRELAELDAAPSPDGETA